MARTRDEKRDYYRKYYADHKPQYSKWAKDRRERIKKEREANSSRYRQLRVDRAKPDTIVNVKEELESINMAELIDGIMMEECCRDS